MTIEVEVRGFTGTDVVHNTSPNVPINYSVGMPELVHRAITVGGKVTGPKLQRGYRRGSIGLLCQSAVEKTPHGLVTTELFRFTEASEKAGISFRLGMAFAAIVASRVLKVPNLTHVKIKGNSKRADLEGRDKSQQWHVVEAKGRATPATWQAFEDAIVQGRTQAIATKTHLGKTKTVHTASVAAAALLAVPIRVVLEDPPVGDGPAESEGEVERFFQRYYAPVVELLELGLRAPSGNAEVDERAIGGYFPGTTIWFGLDRAVHDALPNEDSILFALERFEDVRVGLMEGAADRIFAGTDGHVLILDGVGPV